MNTVHDTKNAVLIALAAAAAQMIVAMSNIVLPGIALKLADRVGSSLVFPILIYLITLVATLTLPFLGLAHNGRHARG